MIAPMQDILSHIDLGVLQQGYILPVLVLLLACIAILPLLERLRISPVLGYLLAGLICGPSVLGLVAHSNELDSLADLGVVFLLFLIGLNLSWAHFRSIQKHILRIGLPQVAISGIVISLIAWQWDHSLAVTILLGVIFALSSTAIVSQQLLDTGQLHNPKGKIAMAVLLAQDIAVVPLLVMVKVFSEGHHDNLLLTLVATFIKAIAAIVIVVIMGRYVLRPVYHYLHRQTKTPEITIALSLLAVLAAATLTNLGGLSMELGAFLAGLILSESEFQDKIQRDIRPFQGLLLGLFFITVGMQIDITAVIDTFGWLVISVLGLSAIKIIVITALTLLSKQPLRDGLPAALLLGQGSEFAFVVIGVAMESGLMPVNVAQFMLLVTALSMLATPIYMLLSDKAEKHLSRKNT